MILVPVNHPFVSMFNVSEKIDFLICSSCLSFHSVIDPAIIKKTTELVMVDEYHNAHLECFIDANPINEHVIQWIRRSNDSDYGSLVHHHHVPLTSSFDDSDDIASLSSHRMHSEVELLSEESQPFADGAKLKSSLLIINVTLRDSGSTFECVANNGIGKEVKSAITLLVLRKYFRK